MNILLFVTSLLMILSLMTYARIDSFRYFLGMDAGFERYMSTIERSNTNKAAEQWYKASRAPRKKNENKPDSNKEIPQRDKSTKPKGKSAPRISFRFFTDKKMREENPQAYLQTKEWAKALMVSLYGNRKFFREAQQQNSTFMDQILESLERATEELPKEKKPKEAKDLSNLELDPSIHNIFYHMVKGCSTQNEEVPKSLEKEKSNIIELPSQGDREEDDEDVILDAEEYCKEGYDSILNYITLRDTTRIRVYLAPKSILSTIFGGSQIADNIINARQALYNAVSSDKLSAQDATQQFADSFKGSIGRNDEDFLDFKVSLTNPSTYK